eukprot:14330985-Heterocapsa_arctica.AAC.1
MKSSFTGAVFSVDGKSPATLHLTRHLPQLSLPCWRCTTRARRARATATVAARTRRSRRRCRRRSR